MISGAAMTETTWALVLAAGDGTRLLSLTTTESGTAIAKQFCSLRGGPSLLHEALKRAREVTSSRNICAVVAEQHRRWWESQLRSLPEGNCIVQPQNRGTAIGILLPLVRILERDPGARIVLLPSDHHVRDEAILMRAIHRAVEALDWHFREAILLGFLPEDADPELGYIAPGKPDGRGVLLVERFVEKPSAAEARQLIERGALWNAFITVATGEALLALFRRRIPGIVNAMRLAVASDLLSCGETRAVVQLYAELPCLDFSRDILQGQEHELRVLTVPRCGWSDLGTPERVAHALRRAPLGAAADDRRAASVPLSLASQHERLQVAAARSGGAP
ncbi:MAG TPA: sugar phosphate nucleotidyltransferase [Steroidobacteraceae bacterium]|nr:sugar phosphate nucleotidyltransferase [Steroidobacteraceae bacterium]